VTDAALYGDPLLTLEDGVLTIGGYYGAAPRRIRLDHVHGVTERSMGRLGGRLRIWGSGDLRHWWNLDTGRPRKTRAFEIDMGGWIVPTVTPDDPDGFAAALTRAGIAVTQSDQPIRWS